MSEIHEHARRRPFVPFRVFLSDGSGHVVRHPDFIFVMQREVVIGIASGAQEIPGAGVYIDPIHITRIEPIGARRSRTKPRRTR